MPRASTHSGTPEQKVYMSSSQGQGHKLHDVNHVCTSRCAGVYMWCVYLNYSQSIRWSKRPASQCVRRLVKASDVIGQCVRCGWSKCPRSLVNASGTNDVVIRLSDLINYKI